MTTVSVSQLWRYPVKSMGGTAVDEVHIDRRGVHADRLWAVRDVENDITATARRVPALLKCTARYLTEPDRRAGPGRVPAVVITFPDGSEARSDDAGVDERLSEACGRRLAMTSLPPESDTSVHKLRLRQVLGAYALSADGSGLDVRRFRPNVLVDAGDSAADYPEAAWAGARVHVGEATLRVSGQTIRCVMPTRPQPGLEADRAITRLLAERTHRFLGVYADVAWPGTVRIGDTVQIHLPEPPGALQRTTTAVVKRAHRGVQRLMEATVLRGR